MTGIPPQARRAVVALLASAATAFTAQVTLASPAAGTDDVPAAGVAVTSRASVAATAFTYVSSGEPLVSFWNRSGEPARVGLVPDGSRDVYRSFFQLPTSAAAGRQVQRATLRATQTWSFGCQPKPVQLWQSGPIDASTTWRTQPQALRLVATATLKGTNSSASCGASQIAQFDVTSVVRAAAESSQAEVTFLLRAPDEADVTQWRRFSRDVRLDMELSDAPTPAAPPTPPAT